MKKIILASIFSATTLLAGCANDINSYEGKSVISQNQKDRNKENADLQKLNRGSYSATYEVGDSYDGTHLGFGVFLWENEKRENIWIRVSPDKLNDQLYKQQLEIIKAELGISKKDFNKLEKAIDLCLDGKYHNEAKNAEGYMKRIVDTNNYSIGISNSDWEYENDIPSELAQVILVFEAKSQTNYIYNSGLEYTSYITDKMDDFEEWEYSYEKDLGKKVAHIKVASKNMESERVKEAFKIVCSKIGVKEKQVDKVYNDIKNMNGEKIEESGLSWNTIEYDGIEVRFLAEENDDGEGYREYKDIYIEVNMNESKLD